MYQPIISLGVLMTQLGINPVSQIVQIEYSKSSIKFITSKDRATKQRIKLTIDGLTEMPPKGDIKPLQGYTIRTYRLCVGKYRIIYRYDTNKNQQIILFISDIDSRGDIYK